MSDAPAPPPQPPPPPPLAPPPGYVGYAETNWRGDLSRVGGLERWISILLGVSVLTMIIGLVTIPSAVDAADDFFADRDDDAFTSSIAAHTVSESVAGLVSIALVVLSIVWLYRVIGNHRTIGRAVTWAPGWAIGGWFLPPFLFVIPMLVLRESWKASTPDGPPTSESWRDEGESPLLWLWFVAYSVLPLVFGILSAVQVGQLVFGSGSGFGGDAADIAEYYSDGEALLYAQSIVSIVAAVAWFLVVRAITARHTRLTGEASVR